MPSLDDIVLVSEEDFAGTYASEQHLVAALRELGEHGITFPIKYSSPFFPQLARLALLVYLKGTVSVTEREKPGAGPVTLYSAYLYVTPKLGQEWVKRKLEPYFSVTQGGYIACNDGTAPLNRPLARILHCLEIPTNDGHLVASDLPAFMTELAVISGLNSGSSHTVNSGGLLLDLYEIFLRVKTTPRDLYWEFFLPIKETKKIATDFRKNVEWFLKSVLPDVPLRRLGQPRQRYGSPLSGSPVYYDSILGMPSNSVKTLIRNYACIMDMDDFLARRPAVFSFFREATKAVS